MEATNNKTNGDNKMKMYHGTTEFNYCQIVKTNMLNAPVYMTPDFETAVEYASNNSENFRIIEIEIEKSELMPDSEFVKSGDRDRLDESIKNGSAYTNNDICILGSNITRFAEFEEV